MSSLASGDPTHRPDPRFALILEKFEKNEELNREEYSLATLLLTFDGMIHTLYSTVPFSSVEPSSLNRNWIIHGRSRSQKNRLDCIKLINFLYAIILVTQYTRDITE